MIEKENYYRLLSIDAWHYDEGWQWNAWYSLEEDIYMPPEAATPKRLFRMLRDKNYLSNYSKGRVGLEDDGYNLVIEDRNTGEPLFALEPQWRM